MLWVQRASGTMSKSDLEELMNANQKVIKAWMSHCLEPHINGVAFDSEPPGPRGVAESQLKLLCNSVPSDGGFKSQVAICIQIDEFCI